MSDHDFKPHKQVEKSVSKSSIRSFSLLPLDQRNFNKFSLPEKLHINCRRCGEEIVKYPNSEIIRKIVPDKKVSWETVYESYESKLPDYTDESVLMANESNDPQDRSGIKFNKRDRNINRESYHGRYKMYSGYPLNIAGRTGLKGKGLLARWGPNHFTNLIITRWRQDDGGRQILQFLAVQKRGEWMIPEGVFNAIEEELSALKRTFLEAIGIQEGESEATYQNYLVNQQLMKLSSELLKNGRELYRGYVDDPRNTDNAWVEAVVYSLNDERGDLLDTSLINENDFKNVDWIDVTSVMGVYPPHISFLSNLQRRSASISRQSDECTLRSEYVKPRFESRIFETRRTSTPIIIENTDDVEKIITKDSVELNDERIEQCPNENVTLKLIENESFSEINDDFDNLMRKDEMDENDLPLNPMGRTGIMHKGTLEKYGPNYTTDSIITRWKRDNYGNVIKSSTTGAPILQFVAVKRQETGDWSIPGGMCQLGDHISKEVRNEFLEEEEIKL